MGIHIDSNLITQPIAAIRSHTSDPLSGQIRYASTGRMELDKQVVECAMNLRSPFVPKGSRPCLPQQITNSGFWNHALHLFQLQVISHSRQTKSIACSVCRGFFTCLCVLRYDVKGWANVPGAIATWNLARLGINTQANPDRLIQVDNSLMCCAFHPAEPVSRAHSLGFVALLVIGSFWLFVMVVKKSCCFSHSHCALSWASSHRAQAADVHC